jgi:nitrite reductase/ring-hydroxylating ferredoxin subunit
VKIMSDDTAIPAIEWVDLGAVSDFKKGSVSVGALPSGMPLAIYRVEDDFYVTADRCTHGGASLSDEGELNGYVIECGWHNGTFDVRTGAALTLPCRSPLPTFSVKVEDERLLLNPKPNRRQASANT